MADNGMAFHPDTGMQLYSAWRVENAQWELAAHTPRPNGEDIPPEIDDAHCTATVEALYAYLMHPAEDMCALARKLETFRDQQIWDGWTRAEEITACLARDARRLALDQPHKPARARAIATA